MDSAPKPNHCEFNLAVSRPTVAAYRHAVGRGETQAACFAAAKAACVAAGGHPGTLGDAVMRMIVAASIKDSRWFYAPVGRRLHPEERHSRTGLLATTAGLQKAAADPANAMSAASRDQSSAIGEDVAPSLLSAKQGEVS